MTCYPIIYTRTSCCDYYPNFHVIPRFVNVNEIRPYILSATTDLDPTVKNPKEIIISNGEYCVWGYVCFSKDFLSEQDSTYTRDNKGRAVYGFFGFAIELTGESIIPVLNIEKCAEIFREYIIPVWNDTVSESKDSTPVQIDEKEMVSGLPQADYSDENTCYYTEKSDLFNALISSVFKDGTKISYCSSIQDYDKLKDCIYSHVVTTSNLIYRLKSIDDNVHTENKTENTEKVTSKSQPLFLQDEIRLMVQGKTPSNNVQNDEIPDNDVTINKVFNNNNINDKSKSNKQKTKVTVKPVSNSKSENNNTYFDSSTNSGKKKQCLDKSSIGSQNSLESCSTGSQNSLESCSTGSQNSSESCSTENNNNKPLLVALGGGVVAIIIGKKIVKRLKVKKDNTYNCFR